MIRRILFLSGLSGVIVMTALLTAAPPEPQKGSADTAVAVAHEQLWNEAAAAVLALAAVPDITTEPIEKLKPAQVRLERAAVGLIQSQPPLERLPDHLLLLPGVQEVAAATLEVVKAREKGDAPGVASGRIWFDQSVASLATTLRQMRGPAKTR